MYQKKESEKSMSQKYSTSRNPGSLLNLSSGGLIEKFKFV